MDDYLFHVSDILKDGLQWEDVVPLTILAILALIRVGVIKTPRFGRKKD